jgi:hypothetical protein
MYGLCRHLLWNECFRGKAVVARVRFKLNIVSTLTTATGQEGKFPPERNNQFYVQKLAAADGAAELNHYVVLWIRRAKSVLPELDRRRNGQKGVY